MVETAHNMYRQLTIVPPPFGSYSIQLSIDRDGVRSIYNKTIVTNSDSSVEVLVLN